MKQDGGRADMTASRQPSASMPDNVSPGPPVVSGNPFGRLSGNLSRRPAFSRPAWTHLISAAAMPKSSCRKPADPHCRRHLILRHPDAFTAQLLWPLDAAIVADIDRRVTEGARQKSGDGDVRRPAARQGDQIRAKADLRHLELAMEKSPLKALFHRHGKIVDVASFDAHTPVEDGAHAIIVPGSNGDRKTAHVAPK